MIDKESLSRWSLERVQFVLGHLEEFIDDDAKEMRERSKNFVAQTGLEKWKPLPAVTPPILTCPRFAGAAVAIL